MSSLTTDMWEPDEEVGGEMHLLFGGEGVEAGLSRFAESTEAVTWTLPAWETLLVLEGRAKIDFADGSFLELRPGDIASLPKGAETTWHITAPFKEFWVMA